MFVDLVFYICFFQRRLGIYALIIIPNTKKVIPFIYFIFSVYVVFVLGSNAIF